MYLIPDLDCRTAEILRTLCKNQTPLSATRIGQEIGSTARSVNYHLNRIKPWLKKNGISVISKPNFGIALDATVEQITELGETIQRYVYYSKGKRIYIILFALLTKDTPLQIQDFEEILSISRSTAINSLHEARAWLYDYHLMLKSKPNCGYWIEGKETNIREALYQCIMKGSCEFHLQNELMEFCFSGKSRSERYISFIGMVSEYFFDTNIFYINNLINTILDIKLSDRSNYSLILKLAIMISRCRQKKFISIMCPGLGDIKQKNEYYWAEFLGKRFSKYFDITIGLEEISFIIRFLIDSQTRRPLDKHSSESSELKDLDQKLCDAIDSFLCQVSKRLHPSLMLDAELKSNLALHLSNIYFRTDEFFPEDNPVIIEIKKEYPRIHTVVSQSIADSKMSILKKYPDEIGYLTIHIATALERLQYQKKENKTVLLVCNTGAASALLLKTKIQSEFPEIIIENVISYKDLLGRRNFRAIDFIISTIPLQIVHAPPILVVEPLLREKDIENLRKAFIKDNSETKSLATANEHEGPSLISLIDAELIRLNLIASGWEGATDKAGELLLNQNIIEKRYIISMKKTIREFGPFMVAWPGVALLHASHDSGARKLGMSLITLKKSVEFGHLENDPVDIVIALSIPSHSAISLALDQLNCMLSDQNAVRIIRSAQRSTIVLNQIMQFSQEPAFSSDTV